MSMVGIQSAANEVGKTDFSNGPHILLRCVWKQPAVLSQHNQGFPWAVVTKPWLATEIAVLFSPLKHHITYPQMESDLTSQRAPFTCTRVLLLIKMPQQPLYPDKTL